MDTRSGALKEASPYCSTQVDNPAKCIDASSAIGSINSLIWRAVFGMLISRSKTSCPNLSPLLCRAL